MGWVPAGDLPGYREEMALAPLGDGRAIIVGMGYSKTERRSVPTADLWDLRTASWRPTEPLNKLRIEFAMTTLSDGRVLVVGGTNEAEQSFSSAYTYDPTTETWTKAGVMGTARTSPTVAALPDGRALVMGGFYRTGSRYGCLIGATARLAGYFPDVEPPRQGAALATAEVLGTDGTWASTGAMRYARFGAQAVTLADGRVLVFGSGDTFQGVTVDGNAAYTSEIYDPATSRFSHLATLPAIDRKTLNQLNGSGGNSVPEDRPERVSSGTLVALDNGGAVLIGWRGNWKAFGDIARSFRYDALRNAWTDIGHTTVGIWEPSPKVLLTEGVVDASDTAAKLRDGRVLIAGGSGPNLYPQTGYNEAYTSAAAWAFDPVPGTWTDLPPMPAPRDGAVAVSLADGSVLVVGGSAYLPAGVTDEEMTAADEEEEEVGDNTHVVNRLSTLRFAPSS